MCKSMVDTSTMVCKCNEGVNPAASAGYDRAAIVHGMCMTWRHDYGLTKREEDRESMGFAWEAMCGMTRDEQQFLYSKMDQVFQHNIKPLLERL